MSHKTLIGGTAYDIIGGKTLASGTSYSIKNGKVLISGTAYDISFFLPPDVLDIWNGTTSYGSIAANCIIYANGYWVVGGRYYDGSTYYARIAYTTKLDGTWTIKDIWSGNSGTINCITYANGYWVVGGGAYDGTKNYARIAYATSLDGTWTNKDIWSNNNYSRNINGIAYGNGYWVICGAYATSSAASARVAYATSLDGTWTTTALDTGFDYMTSLIYANGSFVVCGQYTATNYEYARIAYTENPSSWTDKNVWSTRYSCYIECVTYRNGYWVIGGRVYDGTYYYGRITYATSLDGTWTNKDIWSGERNSSYYPTINEIAYDNGYWVAVGQNYGGSTASARVAYATSLDGTWTNKDIWTGNRTSAYCVTYGDGYWAVFGRAINTNYCARLAYATKPEEIGDTN